VQLGIFPEQSYTSDPTVTVGGTSVLQSLPTVLGFSAVVLSALCLHSAAADVIPVSSVDVLEIFNSNEITITAMSTAPPIRSKYSSAPCPFLSIFSLLFSFI